MTEPALYDFMRLCAAVFCGGMTLVFSGFFAYLGYQAWKDIRNGPQ